MSQVKVTRSHRICEPKIPRCGRRRGPGPAFAAQRRGNRRSRSTPARRGRSREIRSPTRSSALRPIPFTDSQAVIDFIEQDQPREEYGRYGNPGERVAERKLAALDAAEDAALFSSGMAAIVGLLMAKLNAGDEVIFLRRVLSSQPRVLLQTPLALRRCHAAGQGVRLRRYGSGNYSADQTAGQRVAHEPASQLRRPRPLCGSRREPRHRDAHRRHARDALQPAADSGGRRLRTALGHQIPRRTQRSAWRAWSSAPRRKLADVRNLRGIMGGVNSPQNMYTCFCGA